MGASDQQKLSAAERRRQAYQLRLAGMDLRTIAQQVGYADASAAKKAIDRAIQESIAREQASMDELRRLQVTRYDRIQASFWTQAVKDKNPAAAKIVLECMKGRERIEGTTAPTHINIDARRLADDILGMMDDGSDLDASAL